MTRATALDDLVLAVRPGTLIMAAGNPVTQRALVAAEVALALVLVLHVDGGEDAVGHEALGAVEQRHPHPHAVRAASGGRGLSEPLHLAERSTGDRGVDPEHMRILVV